LSYKHITKTADSGQRKKTSLLALFLLLLSQEAFWLKMIKSIPEPTLQGHGAKDSGPANDCPEKKLCKRHFQGNNGLPTWFINSPQMAKLKKSAKKYC